MTVTKEYSRLYYQRHKEYWKRYRIENRGRIRKANRQHVIKCRYGVTLEGYNKMLKEQNSCCAICGGHKSEFSKALGIDHDHETGRIRGLLCTGCNLALGSTKTELNSFKCLPYKYKTRKEALDGMDAWFYKIKEIVADFLKI